MYLYSSINPLILEHTSMIIEGQNTVFLNSTEIDTMLSEKFEILLKTLKSLPFTTVDIS
jgi:hypothetical protein